MDSRCTLEALTLTMLPMALRNAVEMPAASDAKDAPLTPLTPPIETRTTNGKALGDGVAPGLNAELGVGVSVSVCVVVVETVNVAAVVCVRVVEGDVDNDDKLDSVLIAELES